MALVSALSGVLLLVTRKWRNRPPRTASNTNTANRVTIVATSAQQADDKQQPTSRVPRILEHLRSDCRVKTPEQFEEIPVDLDCSICLGKIIGGSSDEDEDYSVEPDVVQDKEKQKDKEKQGVMGTFLQAARAYPNTTTVSRQRIASDITSSSDESCSSSCKAITKLPCQHFFHEHCIVEWVVKGRGRSCPLCHWKFRKMLKKDIDGVSRENTAAHSHSHSHSHSHAHSHGGMSRGLPSNILDETNPSPFASSNQPAVIDLGVSSTSQQYEIPLQIERHIESELSIRPPPPPQPMVEQQQVMNSWA
eukprot:CAMPEP_0184698842 /NCGR_PEP_ID=MMETSP0313-20130426/5313_1 /TAXON_ID=2792 /ORGANISM="Porphyridium aerugineum, Strain SAG 1380-2" /LENGTH=305 /DNA_ID=CAMNT_0027157833 /DNA_START=587 /DNA_END=1504 /DNA_ORIENTATION=+